MESAFIANYHREDMTDIEEAHALKPLVDSYGGSQTRARRRPSMSASTPSSKLSLLKLSPELQKDLMTGERKTEHVRNLSKLSPETQKAKSDERAEASKRRARSRQQPESEPADFHGAKSHSDVMAEVPEQLPSVADTQTAPKESIPEPRGANGSDGRQDQ